VRRQLPQRREIYSFHPGIANSLFADGHVRFVSASTDIRVIARLITAAAGSYIGLLIFAQIRGDFPRNVPDSLKIASPNC
jgi:prepilin-type processing-associated H-X9-DG protein